jgi:hypothetical protein
MPDAENPDGSPKKPDLRFTSRVDDGVSINRDFSQQGRLARGSHTNMSSIKFSMQAQSRDYVDPELAALHADPSSVVPKHVKQANAAKAEALKPAVAEVVVPDAVVPGSIVTEVVSPSMLGRFAGGVRRWFGNR